jgi:hypothetical protein
LFPVPDRWSDFNKIIHKDANMAENKKKVNGRII